MNISEVGKNLIKSFEGCVLTAYKPVQTEQYYTIGWGTLWPRCICRNEYYSITSRCFI